VAYAGAIGIIEKPELALAGTGRSRSGKLAMRAARRTHRLGKLEAGSVVAQIQKLERETGCEAPSTKQSVEFIYRLG
jgi:hypothetical protein